MLAAVPAAVVSADDHEAGPSVYDIAKDASKGRWIVDRNGDDFDILVLAVKLTGLKGALDDPNADLTVFAPTDQTFEGTFGGRTEVGTPLRVLRAVNSDRSALADILVYHVTGLSFAEVAAALRASAGGTVEVPMLAVGATSRREADAEPFVADAVHPPAALSSRDAPKRSPTSDRGRARHRAAPP